MSTELTERKEKSLAERTWESAKSCYARIGWKIARPANKFYKTLDEYIPKIFDPEKILEFGKQIGALEEAEKLPEFEELIKTYQKEPEAKESQEEFKTWLRKQKPGQVLRIAKLFKQYKETHCWIQYCMAKSLIKAADLETTIKAYEKARTIFKPHELNMPGQFLMKLNNEAPELIPKYLEVMKIYKKSIYYSTAYEAITTTAITTTKGLPDFIKALKRAKPIIDKIQGRPFKVLDALKSTEKLTNLIEKYEKAMPKLEELDAFYKNYQWAPRECSTIKMDFLENIKNHAWINPERVEEYAQAIQVLGHIRRTFYPVARLAELYYQPDQRVNLQKQYNKFWRLINKIGEESIPALYTICYPIRKRMRMGTIQEAIQGLERVEKAAKTGQRDKQKLINEYKGIAQ